MYGHKDMLLFLNTKASSREITSISTPMVSPLTIKIDGSTTLPAAVLRTDGSTILHAAVLSKAYVYYIIGDVAIEIMEIYPELASYRNGDDATASHILALSPSSFKSGTKYAQQYLGATPFVLVEKVAAIIYSCFPVLKLIYNAKLKHGYAIQLLRMLLEKDCGQWTMNYGANIPHGRDDIYNNFENQHSLPITTKVNTYRVKERPIILATKLGIAEMFKEIIEVYPESIRFRDEEAGRNLLHLAAEFRHESILELLKSSSTNSKRNLDMLVIGIDRDGNTPLHAAAKLGKLKPWHIRGAAQWMQWECVWFQRVKRMLPPHMLTMKNCNNQYAHQVFTETHKHLRKEGEKWFKEGSENYMFISALLATVMFASAFAVPGGNDSTSGRPILLKNQDFVLFLHYVGYSLFFSIISLGLFLTIHAAPFNEHDFFLRLPLRFVFAVTALFQSFTFTTCAFFQAYMLITGWTGSMVWFNIDTGLGLLGLFFSADLYVDIVGCFIRYLIDILFI
ncbi:uncharacterized protein LOC113361587 [Papaver somniferum]|uniref:uncharacterized protein LOC113361587 n=1 Tax=Papaver somniferum TaxID=3469 RepID=UPI000E6F7FBB|nr:uncharacterized protein LOC113361587 [Papaver somniferum]